MDPVIQSPHPSSSPLIFLFRNARGLRSAWRLLIYLALSAIFAIVPVIVLVVLMIAQHVIHVMAGDHHQSQPPTELALIVEWIVFAATFGAAVFVSRLIERRPVASLGLGFHQGWFRNLLIGLAAGIMLLSVVFAVVAAAGGYRLSGPREGAGQAFGWGLIMALLFLGVGLCEEFLFRGYLLQNLTDGINLPAAAVISCVAFGLVHTGNHGENAIGIASAALAGLLLLILILRTRSLWLSVGLHAAWDWGQNFLYGTPDSGMVLPHGLLLTTAHGPAWLTGGADGPEGSLVAIVVLLLACLYCAKARWIRPAPEAALLWDRYVAHTVADPAVLSQDAPVAEGVPTLIVDIGSLPEPTSDSIPDFDLTPGDNSNPEAQSPNNPAAPMET